MNLRDLLQRNNNIPQLDTVIIDDVSQPQLTQQLQQRLTNNDVQDRTPRRPFSNLFNRLADVDNILEPKETPAIKMNNFYNERIVPAKERLVSGLYGKLVPNQIENNNNTYYDDYGNTQLNSAVGNSGRLGGLLNDIRNGFNENYNNGFQMSNLINDNGQRKGLGFRMGEGIGTLGRIAQSPLGRAAIVGGLVGLTGGGALPALTFGSMAGMLNQQNRMKNKMYRQQLDNAGIEIPNEKGYLNDDTFKKLWEFQKAQNDDRRQEQNMNRQWENAELNRALQKNAQDLTRRGQDLNYSVAMARLNASEKKAIQTAEAKQKADDLGDIQKQLDNFANTFETVNNPYRYRLVGGLSEKMNTLSDEEANFNAQRTLLFNQIARKLGGEKGVLSDKDIERVDAALPKLSDTLAQKRAKMKAIYDLLEIKQGSNADFIQEINDNPLGLDL